jgi:hypothetical protein
MSESPSDAEPLGDVDVSRHLQQQLWAGKTRFGGEEFLGWATPRNA